MTDKQFLKLIEKVKATLGWDNWTLMNSIHTINTRTMTAYVWLNNGDKVEIKL